MGMKSKIFEYKIAFYLENHNSSIQFFLNDNAKNGFKLDTIKVTPLGSSGYLTTVLMKKRIL